jgi:hypothetical protein
MGIEMGMMPWGGGKKRKKKKNNKKKHTCKLSHSLLLICVNEP